MYTIGLLVVETNFPSLAITWLVCPAAAAARVQVSTFFSCALQHDVHRKPQGLIILDEKCRVSRADGANTFEIATENKTYYLTADSQPLMEDWVRVLQNVVQRNALKLLLSREDGISPTLQVFF